VKLHIRRPTYILVKLGQEKSRGQCHDFVNIFAKNVGKNTGAEKVEKVSEKWLKIVILTLTPFSIKTNDFRRASSTFIRLVPVAEGVAVAEGPENGDTAGIVSALAAALAVIAGAAVVARDVPVRPRPSGRLPVNQAWRQNSGDDEAENTFHCF
jgi:hypothetical protein